jgi:hypothetical protein
VPRNYFAGPWPASTESFQLTASSSRQRVGTINTKPAGSSGARRRPETPVLVLENVSRHDQLIERITLARLTHGLETPHGPMLVMLSEAMETRPPQSG